ncbi:MAG: CDP-glycerol glycerophosphotransferase family protein [Verrucomicrobiota bacterium]|nr:CDP-glycerol glycerophosphotransferase family protein [Verrucomicrobiota bacterium]
MLLKACAFNTGPDIHLLDHIAPLASILNIPLIVTEEENELLAAKYYPEVSTERWTHLEFHLKEIADRFDLLIECKYWAPHLKELFRTLFHKKMELIFCPHGQSDKGYATPLLAPYATQDGVLLYGNLLKKMLEELNIQIPDYWMIGNHRWLYFQTHRERLRAAAQKEVFSFLDPKRPTLLYAPTWQDADQSTSFFETFQQLNQKSDWNVLIKIHPLLSQRDPALFCRLTASLENVFLIHEFPPVYPLLERIDAYLGDYSSVGYDVLAFQKPMFLLARSSLPLARLHSCGQRVHPDRNLLFQIEKNLCKARNFEPLQRELYEKAFGSLQAKGGEDVDRSKIRQILRRGNSL